MCRRRGKDQRNKRDGQQRIDPSHQPAVTECQVCRGQNRRREHKHTVQPPSQSETASMHSASHWLATHGWPCRGKEKWSSVISPDSSVIRPTAMCHNVSASLKSLVLPARVK